MLKIDKAFPFYGAKAAFDSLIDRALPRIPKMQKGTDGRGKNFLEMGRGLRMGHSMTQCVGSDTLLRM